MSAEFATTLDLRQAELRERHPLPFGSFESLLPGQSLQLINDHDTRPLCDQLRSRCGDTVTWSCLESGPALWRVLVGRKAPDSGNCCFGGSQEPVGLRGQVPGWLL